MNTEPNKNDRRRNSPNYGKHGIQPFDGFPYYVTRIVPALYHVILLPSEWTEDSLVDFAETQASFNNLEACLALSQNHGLWFTLDGGKTHSHHIPAGGILINGGLKVCREFHHSSEFEQRARRLDTRVQETRSGGLPAWRSEPRGTGCDAPGAQGVIGYRTWRCAQGTCRMPEVWRTAGEVPGHR